MRLFLRPTLLTLLLTAAAFASRPAAGQPSYDASWYDADAPHVKIAVSVDGVYEVRGRDLADAGVSLSAISPSTMRLYENGKEIPIRVQNDDASFSSSDSFAFIGQRNRGFDELWAYNYNSAWQSSPYRSLYTNTTYYWLTWGGKPGLRYQDENASPPGGATPLTTARDTLHQEQNNDYYYGDARFRGDPRYTRGEGYYWARLKTVNSDDAWTHSLTLNAPASDGTLHARVRLNGVTRSNHIAVLQANTSDGWTTVSDTLAWFGYAFRTLRGRLSQATRPGDGELHLRVLSLDPDGDNTNRISVDYVEVDYVRTLEAEGGTQSFTLPQADSYAVTARGYSGETAQVFNEKGRRFSAVSVQNGAATFGATPSGPVQYWVVQPDALRSPDALQQDEGSDLAAPSNRADYVILTAPALAASAQAMADYRQSEAGGGHSVKVVSARDVYDQFDYGRRTPVAIRRFVRAALQWEEPARFLLIWGDAPYTIRTAGNRGDSPFTVPTYGYSASDAWFAAQTQGRHDWTEALAIGRITAASNEEGRLYLEKMQNYEGKPPAYWKKNALMLAGGQTRNEQAQLQQYTTEWARTLAQPPTGMDTLKYYKRATGDGYDNSFQDSLQADIHQGAAWLNFFGHSSATKWEIDVGRPSEFDNADRLPFVVSLGCRTGAFAGYKSDNGVESFGEQLVTGSLNGAIGHWGASETGTIGASSRLNDKLIDVVFRDTMRVMGLATQEAKNRYARAHGDVRHSLQYNLLGDPATRLTLPDRPDLKVAESDVTVEPTIPIPADSQLTVTADLYDLGLVPRDSVTTRFTHESPSGRTFTQTRRLAPFRLQRTISLQTPIGEDAVGANSIRLTLDPERALDEISEMNNTASKEPTVFSSGLTQILPKHLGITLARRPMLRVSLATDKQVGLPIAFQLDTIPSFDSPALRKNVVTTSRIYADWKLREPLDAGQTYYWRARIKDAGASKSWVQTAFTVRPDLNQRGWLQQKRLFARNEKTEGLTFSDGHWQIGSYGSKLRAVSARVGGGVGVNSEDFLIREHGFKFLLLDGQSGRIKAKEFFTPYPDNKSKSSGDPDQAREDMKTFLDALETDDYLVMSTRFIANRGEDAISEELTDRLSALGSEAADTVDYKYWWTLIAHVGHPGETSERTDRQNPVAQDTTIAFNAARGETLSPRIGPAKSWQTVDWQESLQNAESEIRVDVLSADGETTLLKDVRRNPGTLQQIDPAQHPYLRLRATLVDNSRETTPQLESWHVTYSGIADLALDPSSLVTSADTLQKGAPMKVKVKVRNLSNIPSGRAAVQFALTDRDNRTTLVYTDTLASVPADSTRTIQTSFTTERYVTEGSGRSNQLRLSVNQPNLPEAVTYNNLLIHAFDVRGDQTPPRFHVTIDGAEASRSTGPLTNLQDPNIPFVSMKPTIRVNVEDDSNFQPITNSDLIDIYLNCDPEDPATTCETVHDTTFTPASDDDSTASVAYHPDLGRSDTTHTLYVVVRDVSGNEAQQFRTYFRVQRDVEVQTLFPYPNPMHDFTYFAFQLRGANTGLVDDFRIRIFTVTGRLVRELDLLHEDARLVNEGAGITPNWNRLRWDTRDEDGDRVASGVYLYKVYLRADKGRLAANDAPVEKLVVIR